MSETTTPKPALSPEILARQSQLSAQSRLLNDGTGRVDINSLPDVLTFAGVPQRLAASKFADVRPPDVASAVRSAITDLLSDDRWVGINIVGLARTGKSTAAAACLRAAAKSGRTIAWRSTDDLTSSNYETVRGSDAEREQAEEERWMLRSVYDVLVIDNLDLLSLTEFSARHVWSIVHGRADGGLHTIVTAPPMAVADREHFNTVAVLAARSLLSYINGAMIRVECQRAVS
jgi:hypothetical protein